MCVNVGDTFTVDDVAWRDERFLFKIMLHQRIKIVILSGTANTRKGAPNGLRSICYTTLLLSFTELYFVGS